MTYGTTSIYSRPNSLYFKGSGSGIELDRDQDGLDMKLGLVQMADIRPWCKTSCRISGLLSYRPDIRIGNLIVKRACVIQAERILKAYTECDIRQVNEYEKGRISGNS